jgi:hypothetical protein
MEVSGQLHALAALPVRKNLWYPLNRRLGGPHSQSGHFEEEKNFLPYQESNPGSSSQQTSHYTNYAIPALTDVINGGSQWVRLSGLQILLFWSASETGNILLTTCETSHIMSAHISYCQF